MSDILASPADMSGEFIAELESLGRKHRAPFDDGQVTWRCFGEGPPLVLLHGGHGSWLHWVRNLRAWSTRFTLWVPDMPGYGESDPPPSPTLDSLVHVTRSTLDSLIGTETPVSVAGFSFGGLAATRLALERDVDRLVLLGPAGHGGTRRPRGELRAWRSAARRHDVAALDDAMRHNLAVHMLHDASNIDALALRIHNEACQQTRFYSRPISLAGGLVTNLDRYDRPLLLVLGEHDVTAVPDDVARLVTGTRTGREAVIVPGAGHWVQFEAADQINPLVLDWLSRGARRLG